MSNRFYKTRKNRLVAGVVAGLADKFGWDLALARILAIILMVSTQFGIFLILGFSLPPSLQRRYLSRNQAQGWTQT